MVHYIIVVACADTGFYLRIMLMDMEKRAQNTGDCPTQSNMVGWGRQKLKEFKRHYSKAVGDSAAIFTYNDNQFYTTYAKYLIEYLESRLG